MSAENIGNLRVDQDLYRYTEKAGWGAIPARLFFLMKGGNQTLMENNLQR